MTSSREDLAERLRKHLSLSEPRSCKDLLALAGISIRGGIAQTAGLALVDLQKKGLAKQTTGAKADRSAWLAVAPSSAGPQAETVELPELDAVLTLTTTTARPFGAPTDRTTLAITCTLGPSWPEGTHVPGWSTGLFASQVAQGGLGEAKANGLARMRSVLLALRADPTRDLSPAPPEVPVSDNETISALLAYCAGVSGGAKDSSVHSWLKARRVSRIRAEELLEQLVSEGRLRLVEKPIAGGEVVLRYLPAESVEPAPLPRSDAPPEEPHPPVPSETPAPIEEPVMVAGAPEPCQGCDARDTELARISSWLEKVRSDRDAARVMADLYGEAICGLVPDLRGASPVRLAEGLEDLVRDLRQERDRLADTLGIRTSERDDLAVRLDRTEDHRYHLALLAGLDGGAEWSAVRTAIARALQEATPRPAVDGGTLATYLTRLTDEQWLTVQRGRAQLAEARDLRAKAAALEADGTRILKGLLDTPAGAQAPAPVAPEPPVELVPPPPPPSGEQPAAGGTMVDRALEFFQAHPTEGFRAQQLADALGGDRQSWTVPLSQLTTRGEIERVERGVYRLARKSRRAA